MLVRHLPACDHERERWRNGAGWTRQVLRVPAHGEPLLWRASIAEIDADCMFSPFPGCSRDFALLGGEGCRLRFADGREVVVEPPHGRARFDGEDVPHCSVAGRVQAFNLIADRERIDASLLHRPLVGPMVFFPEPDVTWLLLLLSGRADFPDRPDVPVANAGDALLLHPEAEDARRIVLSGGGELLLARLAPR